ncbi:F0F1 ATP synthase subunit B [bacterium (Candidatus Blackallbacteria) CG17_big_fil_post_rev_8_21_14_2_50_48_46]|uniref:ATP synthase subunit b n=1 Tax=bacterium (Candidatus Blackallbacteria) CG17_big_fil_post_rev_8_21_14_2_50_48_46 TaxID=2014261 RepID=A0A2M7G0B4_9BACT|nr:MAG: F0F1 ATP synthase subunit B [bacterium (Candidatus Blackallbacteria) CG18_big_fil_WC_8_21_14_2_50_49_26]PIW15164.1 MAG: F0F1 ATP synthase subunit B [bacterium (Candidatus Blackallbacteria) CG17_big_fil_post_rev_8_21_14_2_50_48_46]PIW50159.1 MAG: F0F1 ATP synthase subunit B [bacterium (Candidatus Blackallbacteria) CG13_big_fil_rev_8_21_14_2_50_49_14]
MLFDWFTVAAQGLNFLILVWLMKRFLYQPVLNAIEARESRVAGILAEAQAKESAAEQEKSLFQNQNTAFAKQREKLLEDARKEAQNLREKLLAEAHQTADELKAKHQQALLKDQEAFNHALRQRTQAEVLAISRQVLADLANIPFEAQMLSVFLQRLENLPADTLQVLRESSSSSPLILRTAQALSAEQRQACENHLKNILGAQSILVFEPTPTLIGGLELSRQGHKLAWSIEDYLTELENSAHERIQAKQAEHVSENHVSPP